MYASRTTERSPITTGPRTWQRSTTAPSPITTRPSRRVSVTVPSMRVSSVSRISRLASSMSSSRPVSFHQPVTTCGSTARPRVDEALDRVGDLELAAPRGLERLAASKTRLREQVDADEREVRARLLRLLDQRARRARRASSATPYSLRVRHLLQQDHGVGGALAEAVDEALDAVAQQVVAEEHAERVVADELLGDQDRVRQAARGVLLQVGDLEAEGRAVADRRADLLVRVAHDDADLADAGLAASTPGRRTGPAGRPPARAAWPACA